ncbi:hypothetical protein CBS101457_000191 [Exobasidium rhododendri]|nr:hypothetical protein CBS101457_000191 [Exobasidium rhododendri]
MTLLDLFCVLAFFSFLHGFTQAAPAPTDKNELYGNTPHRYNVPSINTGRSRSNQGGLSGSHTSRLPHSESLESDYGSSTSRLNAHYLEAQARLSQYNTDHVPGTLTGHQGHHRRRREKTPLYGQMSELPLLPESFGDREVSRGQQFLYGNHTSQQLGLDHGVSGYSGDLHIAGGSRTGLDYNVHGEDPNYGQYSHARLPIRDGILSPYGAQNDPLTDDYGQYSNYPSYSAHHGYAASSSAESGSSIPFGQPDIPPLLDYADQPVNYHYDYDYNTWPADPDTHQEATTGDANHGMYDCGSSHHNPSMQQDRERRNPTTSSPAHDTVPLPEEMHLPAGSRTLITPPADEYTLQVDPHITYPTDAESVYRILPKEHRQLIVERVSQTRPFLRSVIQYHVTRHLTPRLARKMLSNDRDAYDEAAAELLPQSTPKLMPDGKMQPVVTWMTSLENWQKREVIRRLAECTLQAPDKLRELLLMKELEPSVSRRILAATYTEDVLKIVQKEDLYVLSFDADNTHHPRPWQKGLSIIQRAALRQRMKDIGFVDNYSCFNLLSQQGIPDGYGMQLLKLDSLAFGAAIEHLLGKNRNGVPYARE